MKRRALIIVLTLSVVVVSIVQAHAGYKGKVVDADTGEPIEGAVVMLTWYRGCLPAGDIAYFDARETVTDKAGFFEIKGSKANLNPLCRVDNPRLLIFKGGYKPLNLTWVMSVFKKDYMKDILSFGDDKIFFKFKRLFTVKERKTLLPGVSSRIPYEKRKIFMKELNRERVNLKLDPVGY